MADERSPLLQNGQEHGAQTLDSDYLAINEHEQADSAAAAIDGSTDTEQQQTTVASQSSVVTVVRFDQNVFIFYSNNIFLKKRWYQWQLGYS
jgi:hypothetical protein